MLNFTQEEIETKLADLMPHGTRHDIAALSGLGESYLKRQFNPNDETASVAFRLLQVICAYDELNPTEAERFWQQIVWFREASKPAATKETGESINIEAGKLCTEFAEWLATRFEGKPADIQHRELCDVKRQLAVVEAQMIAESQNGTKKKAREVAPS